MNTLRELLDELADQLGPPDEGMVAEAVEELTAFVHRLVAAAVDEDVDLAGQYD